ncbi:membrane protein [Intrasporangium oryzae NRRL B-24470]|uniref:Membrane protein n=1 Tax=Intrasporangium oryzae NRRL B-24470 TaxID=1386089 RepID=W9G6R3_9MICO|nr:peptidase C39 family protein [Intrasporangium oryzae]EWT01886.1 membrane protein [Intrasporangium oryzae NRRL B-24470]
MPSRSVLSGAAALQPSRRTVLASLAGAAALVGSAGASPALASSDKQKKGASPRRITRTAWAGDAFTAGQGSGTTVSAAGLAFAAATSTRDYADPHAAGAPAVTYEVASWRSPVVAPGFGLTELVASWNASTPGHSWVEVVVRGTADDGTQTGWYVLGRWAASDPAAGGAIHRTSLGGQATTYATVYTDTLATLNGHTLTDWQLEVRLLRPVGSSDVPTVAALGAMASALPLDRTVAVSATGPACGTTLAVPTYSQEVHIGHYPQWDNGGEAWCSPTSTSMVVAYWGAGPSAAETAWVDPPVDAQVDFTARNVFDYTYNGAGNWPFNTAYAATRGLDGFVTRLRTLTEAEAFIAAGIPLVVSVSFKKGELTGAGYGTNGHLMVIVGFTATGDVVVNDPASHLIPDDNQVRVTYFRSEFENVWIPRTGGIAYVIHPKDHPLPAAPAEANW